MDICECGNIAGPQGYCTSCLHDFEIHLSNEAKLEQFEIYANMPRTEEELETEKAITESLQETTKQQTKGGTNMGTKITDIRVFPYNKEGKLKAFAEVTLNGDLVCRNIRLRERVNSSELVLSFPQREKDGQWRDVVFPLNAKLREKMTKAVIAKYNGQEVTFESMEKAEA